MNMKKHLVGGIFIGCVGGMMTLWGFAQGNQEAKPSSELKSVVDRSVGNPVKTDAKSISAGKKLFLEKCVVCHGEEADGKGEMAVVFEKKPANLTDPAAVGKQTDQQIFDTLTNGKSSMPKFESLPANDQWNIVNFIRSVEAKPATGHSSGSSNDPVKKN